MFVPRYKNPWLSDRRGLVDEELLVRGLQRATLGAPVLVLSRPALAIESHRIVAPSVCY